MSGVVTLVCVVAVSVAAILLVDGSISGVVGSSGGSSVLAVDVLLSTVVTVDVSGLALTPVAVAVVNSLCVVAVVGVVGVVVAVVDVDGIVTVVAIFDSGLALVNFYLGALVNVLTVVNGLALALVNVDICGFCTLVDVLGVVSYSVVVIAVVGIVNAAIIVAVVNNAVVIIAVVDILVDEFKRNKVQFRLLNINRACKSHTAHHQCATEETCAQNFSKLFHCHCNRSLISIHARRRAAPFEVYSPVRLGIHFISLCSFKSVV